MQNLAHALCLLIMASAPDAPQAPSASDSLVLVRLEAMVAEDQALRMDDTLDYQIVFDADRRHRAVVFEMLARDELHTPRSKFLAAFVLQHADPGSCVECYLLAHELSKTAVDMGYEKARRLAAMNLDRYLVFTGRPQKYGTQSNCDSTGRWYLFPIDSLTSDSERTAWGVEPLDSLQAEIDRLNTEPAE